MEHVDSGPVENTEDDQAVSVEGSITLSYQAEDGPDTDGAGLNVDNFSSGVDLTVSNPGITTSYLNVGSINGYFYYPVETGVCEKVTQYRIAPDGTTDAGEVARIKAVSPYLTDEYCLVRMFHLDPVGTVDDALVPGHSYPLERTPGLVPIGANILPYVPEEDTRELVAALNNPLGVVLTSFSYFTNPATCEGLPTDVVNHPDADVTSFPPGTGENTLTATGPICQ